MSTNNKISRRLFLKQTAAASIPMMLPNVSFSKLAGQDSAVRLDTGKAHKKPNFLFIMADDLGWADLSCYGSQDLKTSALDNLAKNGIRFTQAYSNSPVCSATRVAFNTMNYQHRLPIGNLEPVPYRKDMIEADILDNIGISAQNTTLAGLLKSSGYNTALIGKWHLGYFNTQAEKDAKGGQGNGFGPIANGYDEFFGFMSGGVDHFTHTDWYGEDDLWDGEQPVKAEGYSTDLFTDRAIKFIEDQKEANKPFFLNMAYHAPHWPFEVPDNNLGENNGHTGEIIADKWFGLAYPVTKDHPLGLGGFDQGSRKIYSQMVENLDKNIGRLLKALERTGKLDNTIIIFTSDNGGERFSNTWPFVGAKGHLYEGGIRVPAIIRWPNLPANKVSNQVVTSFDWSVTMLAAAGIDVGNFDGIDLFPILSESGKDAEKLVARQLFWRHAGQKAARIGNFKYLFLGDKPSGAPTDALLKFSDMPNYLLGDIDGPPPAFGGPGPKTEYEYVFDLSQDEREQANLIDNPEYREITAELKSAWSKWEESITANSSITKSPVMDERLNKLMLAYGD